ncbi:MAG: hypothetical protein R3C32_07065 [Chloroflexota bacterium]
MAARSPSTCSGGTGAWWTSFGAWRPRPRHAASRSGRAASAAAEGERDGPRHHRGGHGARVRAGPPAHAGGVAQVIPDKALGAVRVSPGPVTNDRDLDRFIELLEGFAG